MTSLLRSAALAALALSVSPSAWADDAAKCRLEGLGSLPVTMEGPRATVAVTVNGKSTRFWLDSGAFFNVMPAAKARELGLPTSTLPQGFIITGIGGSSVPELAKIRDFGLGNGLLHNMEFLVGGSDVGNGLLGANLLGIVDTEFDFAHGKLVLFRNNHCKNVSLAYWSQGMTVGELPLISGVRSNDHLIYTQISINGHTVRALLDTGASSTILSRRAAERVGINLTDPKVVASMRFGGIGSRTRQSWIARTQVISLGGEEIRNSPIRIIDSGDDWSEYDMLLGIDFILSHHVLVSQGQHKIYLTYNGGPIFSATTEGELGKLATRAEGMGAITDEATPTTADQFAGRGSARLSRGDYPGAIADLSAAIKLAPSRIDVLNDRATAYFRSGKPDLAAKDIEAGLVIAPNDHRLLTRHALVLINKGDKAGALANVDAAAATTPKGSLDAVSLVNLYTRLGQANRALALLDPVIDLHHDDSSYAGLLSIRAWNRALANTDLDRAQRDIDSALRKANSPAGMLDTRALVEWRRKDYPAAIAAANAALAKSPKMAGALYIRALAQLDQGNRDAALADLTAARTLSPKIDTFYAAYGMAGPATPAPSAKPAAGTGVDDNDDDDDQ